MIISVITIGGFSVGDDVVALPEDDGIEIDIGCTVLDPSFGAGSTTALLVFRSVCCSFVGRLKTRQVGSRDRVILSIVEDMYSDD